MFNEWVDNPETINLVETFQSTCPQISTLWALSDKIKRPATVFEEILF